MADDLTDTCGGCAHFVSEPWWKQVFFIWRGGLWLGRCKLGAFINIETGKPGLQWWAMGCPKWLATPLTKDAGK